MVFHIVCVKIDRQSLSYDGVCRAATNCDVFVLTKADLDRALSYYPEIAEQIREVAGNRANLVKKRSQIAAKAAAEGKSAADAAKAAAQVNRLFSLWSVCTYT